MPRDLQNLHVTKQRISAVTLWRVGGIEAVGQNCCQHSGVCGIGRGPCNLMVCLRRQRKAFGAGMVRTGATRTGNLQRQGGRRRDFARWKLLGLHHARGWQGDLTHNANDAISDMDTGQKRAGIFGDHRLENQSTGGSV
jgi:hypothetical protein